MRRILGISAALALTAAACGGGSDSQEATEQGAVDAAVAAMQGTLRGEASAVLGFLTDECRSEVDEDEVRLAISLLSAFMESDDFDLDEITVVGEIEAFDGETATVQISYEAPEGADLDGFTFSDDEIDMVYEGDRWRGEDCDFGSSDDGFSGADDDDLDEELTALGLTGTQDDPIPGGTAAPIGGGFEIVIGAWDTDAVERYNTANDTNLILEEGDQFAIVEYTLAYRDDEEPKNLSEPQIELVGSDAIGLDTTGCSALGDDVFFTNRAIFTGGVFEGAACFTGTAAQLDGAKLAVSGGFFQDRKVFFDPAATAATPDTLTGTSGPSPEGDATEDRTSPAPLGTPIELDDWTVQVNGFEPDVTDEVLAGDTFADPPGDGEAYALLNVTYTYTGSDSASVFSVTANLVGDSNVSADDCDFVTVRDELDNGAEVFAGGEVSGNLCFLIDSSDADSMVAWFRSNAGFDTDLEFSAIR